MKVTAGSALNLHFTHDALGDIVSEGEAAGVPTPNESYQYDPLYRLRQVNDATGAPWQSYTYDKTGDRLSKVTANETPDTYSYDTGTHHLTDITGYDNSMRSFDANGNTGGLQANGWIYGLGYDDTNRLTVVQQNGSTLETYGLNGLGERVSKSTTTVQARYVYDESGRLLFELGGGVGRAYIWAGDTLVATLDNGGSIHYVYTDHLGTPRAATSTTSGTPIWTWPWLQNPFGERAASGSGYTLNLRYPGQYYDAETGLSYNYFRDYEPGTGRYIESDPLGLDEGVSTYTYVEASPLQFTDLFGLFGQLPKLPGGAPTPNTCLLPGETCQLRAQRGILTCARKYPLLGEVCGIMWHSWIADDCLEGGGKKCKLPHPPGKPCGS